MLRELDGEAGLTPLHLAAYSGDENVVRLLLNSPGVTVDQPSAQNVMPSEPSDESFYSFVLNAGFHGAALGLSRRTRSCGRTVAEQINGAFDYSRRPWKISVARCSCARSSSPRRASSRAGSRYQRGRQSTFLDSVDRLYMTQILTAVWLDCPSSCLASWPFGDGSTFAGQRSNSAMLQQSRPHSLVVRGGRGTQCRSHASPQERARFLQLDGRSQGNPQLPYFTQSKAFKK